MAPGTRYTPDMREDVAARIHLGKGNIVRQPGNVVLNPTDSSLTSRRGVSGAIHRAAGPALREACRSAGPCREGDIRLTPGYRLDVQAVIHLVMPSGGSREDMRRIRKGYRNVLATSAAEGLAVLVAPPLPAPAGGPGPEVMARIALEATSAWLAQREMPREVHFCCFSTAELAAYETALEGILAETWDQDEFPTDP